MFIQNFSFLEYLEGPGNSPPCFSYCSRVLALPLDRNLGFLDFSFTFKATVISIPNFTLRRLREVPASRGPWLRPWTEFCFLNFLCSFMATLINLPNFALLRYPGSTVLWTIFFPAPGAPVSAPGRKYAVFGKRFPG